MAFDNATRKRLNDFVGEARDLITEEFSQQFQSIYGISANGKITPLEDLGHLDEGGIATASVLRARIDYLIRSHPAAKDVERAAVDRLAREQAFTVLNRLAALRMAEGRSLIVESVGRGYQSKGFQVFERVAGAGLGETYTRYRRYLFCLFDELAVDLGVLFDRGLPQAVLFPREPALLELLGLTNAPELEDLWADDADETIGWIYQYYNDESERKKMREESSAPRDSRELAVRNQFFTPRYVVEFLTDNTLGRLWYEMMRGKTALRDLCRYLVRRPTEIVLKPGESAPETAKADENLSQEQLFRQPVHIPHRPLKDPREIRLLDPACGSMHFGLYAFDLYTVIYDEAWEIAKSGAVPAAADKSFSDFCRLTSDFSSKEEFLRQVPRLIVEHNIHGIDIDPRAAQIAGLSIWLRAQRAWHQAGVKPADRPRIIRSNLVCAEPMPGEKELLREFVEQQFPAAERPAFAFLLEKIFDRMTLAGEAGSLLRIEEEIRTAIVDARALAQQQSKPRQTALWAGDERPEQAEFDLRGLNDEQFWRAAEQRIYDALEAYAEHAESGGGFQRRLFADDAAQGFAFIDLCRRRYDVVVMNPPFGACTPAAKGYLASAHPLSKADLLTAFIGRGADVLESEGLLGAITNRTALFAPSHAPWRKRYLLGDHRLNVVADLGSGVLDAAMVEAAAYTLRKAANELFDCIALQATRQDDKGAAILSTISDVVKGEKTSLCFSVDLRDFAFVPNSPVCYWVPAGIRRLFRYAEPFQADGRLVERGLFTSDDFRFLRLLWEVPRGSVRFKGDWSCLSKGGEYSPFFADIHLLVFSKNEFAEIKAEVTAKYPYLNGNTDWVLHPECHYGRSGATYPQRTTSDFAPRVLPADCFWTHRGVCMFPSQDFESQRFVLLGVVNAQPFRYLVHCLVGSAEGAAKAYEEGLIATLPYPTLTSEASDVISRAAQRLTTRLMQTSVIDEGSGIFVQPRFAVVTRDGDDLVDADVSAIDDHVARAYGLSANDHGCVKDFFREMDVDVGSSIRVEIGSLSSTDSRSQISYIVGCVFGRWDIRYATGARKAPELPDPFAALPTCPPGMLQGEDGLPLSSDAGRRLWNEGRYPLDVAWNGILVDDPEHPLDIERLVQAGLSLVWGDRADEREHEACTVLGVPTLREWLRRPAGFFSDHLKRYSKSRRQAPIYWPLSTASGGYTLWLYSQQLTDQTLHACLADFIEPKLKAVEGEIARAREAKRGADVAKKQDFLEELRGLKAEIEQLIKLPWRPNLNDGALITAAPLWKLFANSKWQKDLKACWEELQAGDYDWAHLAYTIWPQRVKEKCKTDRSLAIAHGLEAFCMVEASVPKKVKSSKKSKSAASDDELALTQTETQSTRPAPKVATPRASKLSSPASNRDDGNEPPISIEDTDRDDVMCVIRQVFSRGGAREREEALKQVSETLGYRRLGTKIREVLETDLLTAVRRGILTNEGGMLSLTSGDIRDFARDSLKDDFLTALGRTWKDREEAIRLFARFLGYARTGPAIEDTARSLINGLIRENRIESDGEHIRRA